MLEYTYGSDIGQLTRDGQRGWRFAEMCGLDITWYRTSDAGYGLWRRLEGEGDVWVQVLTSKQYRAPQTRKGFFAGITDVFEKYIWKITFDSLEFFYGMATVKYPNYLLIEVVESTPHWERPERKYTVNVIETWSGNHEYEGSFLSKYDVERHMRQTFSKVL